MYKPETYIKASKTLKATICNGCGSKGIGGWLIPDTVYFLSIHESCQIHDWMYWEGKTQADKEFADFTFLQNMLDQINEGSNWLKWLREARAEKYYMAVVQWGNKAYWSNKI